MTDVNQMCCTEATQNAKHKNRINPPNMVIHTEVHTSGCKIKPQHAPKYMTKAKGTTKS